MPQLPDTLAIPLACPSAAQQSIPPSHKYPSLLWGLITGALAGMKSDLPLIPKVLQEDNSLSYVVSWGLWETS